MASLKSSRSRGASHTGGAAKWSSKDAGTKLEENINVFNSDNFDADTFVRSKSPPSMKRGCGVSMSNFYLVWRREPNHVDRLRDLQKLAGKLKASKVALRTWNRQVFGHVAQISS